MKYLLIAVLLTVALTEVSCEALTDEDKAACKEDFRTLLMDSLVNSGQDLGDFPFFIPSSNDIRDFVKNVVTFLKLDDIEVTDECLFGNKIERDLGPYLKLVNRLIKEDVRKAVKKADDKKLKGWIIADPDTAANNYLSEVESHCAEMRDVKEYRDLRVNAAESGDGETEKEAKEKLPKILKGCKVKKGGAPDNPANGRRSNGAPDMPDTRRGGAAPSHP